MNPASPSFTMRTVVRARWWMRPINLLLRRPNRWIVEYTDCRFSSPVTIRGDAGERLAVRVDFTAGTPTITPARRGDQ